MIDAQGNQLVFLLCVPRSGSSLVTTILQNHRQVFATQEMWYLMSLYDLPAEQRRPYGGGEIIHQFYNAVLPETVFEQASRSFAREVYNGLMRTSGATHVVDKSPRYYYLLEFLDRLFPQSRRVWLIRNPLAILASYKNVNARSGSFNLKQDLESADFNMKMTDLTAGLFRYYHYFSTDSPYIYRCKYETLVAEPEEETRRLCRFIGVPYEEGIERYGDYMDGAKAEMYYSMGVGDPYLSKHREPHQDSVNSWKDRLEPEEIDAYCRILGADIFHELGYSEELAEAERITGRHYQAQPDWAVITRRAEQLQAKSGCQWKPRYQITTEEVDHWLTDSIVSAEASRPEVSGMQDEVSQLRITLRALEKRLEKSHSEQDRLRRQLHRVQTKIDRVKSLVPFGSRITGWVSQIVQHREGKV
ncbi:sulfotransferase [Paenibacillus sp. JX-17]|uniref:Sulfotransferase n=1 Tax=Paenibacillus lacisoli TaxID=3064525 RepID=A0ABT9CD70_9BACL|nr:sulfotransferase [Paenibacillus sp. JX-17]MDO7907218.1 sulfotransferase [Paenibacillus sp. JX-17]